MGNVNTLYNAIPVHDTQVNAIHQRQMFLGIPVIGSHVPEFWRETGYSEKEMQIADEPTT